MNTNQIKNIENCVRCPRLIEHCKKIAADKKKMYAGWTYWGRPVPDFGPRSAQLLIVGLAPAAHGANRTGRMFTGDNSGLWLYRALHRAGFASQFTYEHADDGLELIDACITAVCHCAPPDNKPSTVEVENCRSYLTETIHSMKNARVYLALGGLAWNALVRELEAKGELGKPKPKFSHGNKVQLKSGGWLWGSYHPSQQNTFTGRLTEHAFDDIFIRIKEILLQTSLRD
jgi:uracil-DNA glycosylase